MEFEVVQDKGENEKFYVRVVEWLLEQQETFSR